ncbi:MAG: CD3072 family TudS-related putative desulfidase [Bacillota bacterium]
MEKQYDALTQAEACEKIMLVCHCVLNPASKVRSFESGERQEEEMLRLGAARALLARGAGLLQLPCPEFTLYGACRWGHVREQLDNPFFRAHCRRLLAPVLEQLAEYVAHPERFHVLGVLGIDGSPSCGVCETCAGDWGGEPFCAGIQRTLSPAPKTKGRGVFLEELALLLNERGLKLPFYSLQTLPVGFSEE